MDSESDERVRIGASSPTFKEWLPNGIDDDKKAAIANDKNKYLGFTISSFFVTQCGYPASFLKQFMDNEKLTLTFGVNLFDKVIDLFPDIIRLPSLKVIKLLINRCPSCHDSGVAKSLGLSRIGGNPRVVTKLLSRNSERLQRNKSV